VAEPRRRRKLGDIVLLSGGRVKGFYRLDSAE
jgi:hypothetical protein